MKAIQNQSKQLVANGSKAREIIVDECTLSKRHNIDATKEKQHRIGPSTKKQRLTFIQWPFLAMTQEAKKLEVPTTYKAYFLRQILEFPLIWPLTLDHPGRSLTFNIAMA